MLLGSPVNQIYYREITVKNVSGPTIPGPIYLVFDGLPNFSPPFCQGGCGLVPAPPVTRCQTPSASGSSLLLWAPSGMGPGQSVVYAPNFLILGSVFTVENYKLRVLSGTPNQ
jgi:hypothetical protein